MKKYTVYVGLFDKDTKTQEITTIDAYKVAANIFCNTTGGATITEAVGVYTHDDGTVIVEPSLRCEVFGADSGSIHVAADQLKTALNQESVAIECAEVESVFY